MQEKTHRSNAERTQATRAALIEAARRLFVEQGYAQTGTPDIVTAAAVTRGALYHHFADKRELFLAVAQAMANEVAEAVAQGSEGAASAADALNQAGAAALQEGLQALLVQRRDAPSEDELAALARLLSAAFDRMALALACGEEAAPYEAAMQRLLRGLAA